MTPDVRKLKRAAARAQRAEQAAQAARDELRVEAEHAREAGMTIRALADVIGRSSTATYQLLGLHKR